MSHVKQSEDEVRADQVTEEVSALPIAIVNAALEDLRHHLYCLSYFLQILTFTPSVKLGNEPTREAWNVTYTAFALLAEAEAEFDSTHPEESERAP